MVISISSTFNVYHVQKKAFCFIYCSDKLSEKSLITQLCVYFYDIWQFFFFYYYYSYVSIPFFLGGNGLMETCVLIETM